MKKILFIILFQSVFLFTLFSQSLLVKISGNGLKKPSYLLGTIHITKQQDKLPIYEKAKSLLNECKSYALEVNMNNPLKMLGLIDQMKLPNNTTYKDYLTPEEYIKLQTIFEEKTGYKFKLFDSFLPLFIESLMELNKNESNTEEVIMMDLDLQHLAQNQKKQVIGIETIEEQLNALTKISLDEQLKSLKQIINNDSNRLDENDMNKIYNQNNASEIYNWLSQNMSEEEMQYMIYDRNLRMCDRATALINKKPTFIAVGAGHLGGEKGLINLLRKKGYIVEDVPF